MKKDVQASLLPSVRDPLLRLGQFVRLARQSRRWTIDEAAQRVMVSPATIKRLEAGDPAVSMGAWANTLAQFGLLEKIVEAAAPAQDALGEALRSQRVVKRVRKSAKEAEVAEDKRYDF